MQVKLINAQATLLLLYQKRRRDNEWVKKLIQLVFVSVLFVTGNLRWYADKDYADLLHEDIKIREYLEERLKDAAVSTIEIERAANRVNVTIHTAKPGMVIGKGGSEVEALRKALNN